MLETHGEDNLRAYLVIIRDNLIRIEKKMARLRELKTDRTIPYIRDIRMLDLSEENSAGMKCRIALAQIDPVLGDLDKNIALHCDYADRARAGGAQHGGISGVEPHRVWYRRT